MSRLIATSLVAAMLAGCATAAPAPQGVPPLPKLSAAAQRGHDFAARRCAGCHAIGLDAVDAKDGPGFYRLAHRYNALSLRHRFTEISAHGVERMPPISFTEVEAEDLVAYFDALAASP